MFERIKCYKKLMNVKKELRGIKKFGEEIHDDYMIKRSEEILRKYVNIEKKMWLDREFAKNFNSTF